MNLHQQRWDKLFARLDGVDAIVLIPGANLRYFIGLDYHRSERPILAFISRAGQVRFILPLLEVSKRQQHPNSAIAEAESYVWSDVDGYADAFRQAVQALDGARLGVDGMNMRVFEWLALARAGQDMSCVQDVGQALLAVRAIKGADEIDAIRRANQRSEDALRRFLDWVKPGMSEQVMAAQLSRELQAAGCESDSFAPIVLTGPQSALPHGNPSSRTLGQDEFLLVDFGGVVDGYPADITRTFCLGAPSADMLRLHEVVQQANEAARRMAAPGVTCGQVDRAAREVIEAAGYGAYFTHRTGHGLGLEGHELPQIAANVDVPLEVGMVFTIEPGIYLPGVGGVRIEDDVVVTADGCESLTSFPRGWQV
ncbi:MAG: Xaa-Pro peptidase family protein [Anaerolineae bacterium]|nr:Xaa-Pro peptidase family protein [Anaerolineae bacterium]MDW8171242.1 Xaa-Pro peptidase family protein [Anaerolineae bacterium]